MLNCQPHDVPVLIASKLLKPLGNPQPNSVKYFATLEVLEQAKEKIVRAELKRGFDEAAAGGGA